MISTSIVAVPKHSASVFFPNRGGVAVIHSAVGLGGSGELSRHRCDCARPLWRVLGSRADEHRDPFPLSLCLPGLPRGQRGMEREGSGDLSPGTHF